MNNNAFNKVIGIVEKAVINDLRLLFVTRYRAAGNQKKPVYSYKSYKVDISDEIRETLLDFCRAHLQSREVKEYSLQEYSVIAEDSGSIFTYSVDSLVSAFRDSIMDSIDSLKTDNYSGIESFNPKNKKEELWAYVVQIKNSEGTSYYLRKIMRGRVATDEPQNMRQRLRAMFNTTSKKLEVVEGETINFDKQIDCIYIDDMFYIFKKTQFEQIVGLDYEYEEKAREIIQEIKSTEMIEGVELLEQLLGTSRINRQLVKLAKLGLYKKLSKEILEKMKETSDEFGTDLKISSGKLVIKDRKDAEIVLKFLVDYFKKSPVTGNKYGTFSGEPLMIQDTRHANGHKVDI